MVFLPLSSVWCIPVLTHIFLAEGKKPDLLLLTHIRFVTFHAKSKNPLLSFLTERYQTPSVLRCVQAEDNLSYVAYLKHTACYDQNVGHVCLQIIKHLIRHLPSK